MAKISLHSLPKEIINLSSNDIFASTVGDLGPVVLTPIVLLMSPGCICLLQLMGPPSLSPCFSDHSLHFPLDLEVLSFCLFFSFQAPHVTRSVMSNMIQILLVPVVMAFHSHLLNAAVPSSSGMQKDSQDALPCGFGLSVQEQEVWEELTLLDAAVCKRED